MPTTSLSDPLTLPCGLTLRNRLGRAAMTEGLSDGQNNPTARLERLYRTHAAAGAGLLLTGNVMVDRRALERARNVVIDGATDMAKLRSWAEACQGTPTLAQLSHPGRQAMRYVQPHPVAPSAGHTVHLGPGPGLFGRPRALSLSEIEQLLLRFCDAGRRALAAGFAGVELHSAHGYLLSSFLDPDINERTDAYGGELRGRARLLLEIVTALREDLGPAAAIAVKVDARDGAEAELIELSGWLQAAGVDLIEVSGGSYESAAMLGLDASGGQLSSAQESPFWASAARLAAAIDIPIMLTGGFRTRAAMERALAEGVAAMVGAGRPLAVTPTLAGDLVDGRAEHLARPAPRLRGPVALTQALGAAAGSGWHRYQLARTADGKPPRLRLPAMLAAMDYIVPDAIWALRWRRSRLRLAQALPEPARQTAPGGRPEPQTPAPSAPIR